MTENPTSLTTEQTASLLEELASMIDSDLSIRNGIRTLEDAQLGSIALAAQKIRVALESGSTLESAIKTETTVLNPQLGVALASSLKGEHPAESLREIAIFLRRQSRFRRQLTWAMIYPLAVVFLGYGVLMLSLDFVLESQRAGSKVGGVPIAGTSYLETLALFWWFPPLVILAIFVVGWNLEPVRQWFSKLFGVGYWGRLSLFCDLSALNLENGCNLPDAVARAAEASGDRALTRHAEAFSNTSELGSKPDVIEGLPPLLSWALLNSELAEVTSQSLRRLGDTYRGRQATRWHMATSILPAALITMLGGGLAFAYIFSVLVPVYQGMY